MYCSSAALVAVHWLLRALRSATPAGNDFLCTALDAKKACGCVALVALVDFAALLALVDDPVLLFRGDCPFVPFRGDCPFVSFPGDCPLVPFRGDCPLVPFWGDWARALCAVGFSEDLRELEGVAALGLVVEVEDWTGPFVGLGRAARVK